MYEKENIEPEFMKRPRTNPFRTPDRYFDSIEDRIMGGIEHAAKKKTASSKVFQILKPVLGLAASFALVYVLVYYPINTFLIKDTAKTAITDSSAFDWLDAYTIDESTLVNTIFSDETSQASETNPDEMLAYLSSGLNDIEIYSEIQK